MEQEVTGKEKSRQIEKYLKEEKAKIDQFNREPKLLILGSSDSGKSTLLKQMKILHGQGFTKEEKENSVLQMRENVIFALATLLRALDGNTAMKQLRDEIVLLEEKYQETKGKEQGLSSKDLEVLKNAWQLNSLKRLYLDQPLGLPDTTE
jgi:energy-coupling factor transporter ATP-binding protein EcfA2